MLYESYRGRKHLNLHMISLPHLEPLILKDLLYGHHFSRVTQFRLVYHTKTSIAYHLGVSIRHLLRPIRTLSRGGYHRCHLATILA